VAYDPLALFANGESGAWYDPSDITTLFQDSEGTTPVTEDGQPVGLMLDKSGNGNHTTQSVSSKRPTYRSIDGLQWIEADGIDDFLSTAPVSGIATDADGMSLMMAVRSTGSRAVLVSQYDSSASNRNFSSVSTTQGNEFQFSVQNKTNFNVNVIASSSGNINSDSIFTGLWFRANNRAELTVNGSNSSSTHALSSVGSAMTEDISLFSLNNGGLLSSGRIYGVIIRGQHSSDQEVTDTEEYLTALTVLVFSAQIAVDVTAPTFSVIANNGIQVYYYRSGTQVITYSQNTQIKIRTLNTNQPL